MKKLNGSTHNGTSNPEMVVSLLIRPGEHEPEILLGPKLSGPMRGYMMPPGGKMENGEARLNAAFRETRQETRFRVSRGCIVGRLHHIVLKPRKKKVIHFTLHRNWKGRLRHCPREFRWLRFFPFSKIPWKKFPPGDAGWLKKVILENKKLKAVVTYRYKNRGWVRTRTYPLYS